MAGWWIVAAMAVGLSGCGMADAGAKRPASGPSTSPVFIGRLEGGQMAIGGEHTGWSLVDASGKELYEVDVRRVIGQANAAKGRRVEVEGYLEQRPRVERGKTTVLVAQRIVPEKE